MNVTLEQARALDAWARCGTFQRAAEALRKGHTAILYALRTLEEQAGLELVDRRGYRSQLTPAGQRVLEQCRKLLAAEREMESLCGELRGGWEPAIKRIDGCFARAALGLFFLGFAQTRNSLREFPSASFRSKRCTREQAIRNGRRSCAGRGAWKDRPCRSGPTTVAKA